MAEGYKHMPVRSNENAVDTTKADGNILVSRCGDVVTVNIRNVKLKTGVSNWQTIGTMSSSYRPNTVINTPLVSANNKVGMFYLNTDGIIQLNVSDTSEMYFAIFSYIL